MDFDTLAKIKDQADEESILRRIGSIFPGASADEVLFRYYLSRAIYFKEYSLPTLPASAHRILALSHNINSSLVDYLEVIEVDPGLAKAVFRLANSPAYAAASECTTLAQAVAHIGLQEVERISMSQAMGNRVFHIRHYESLVKSLTKHLIAAAVGSQEIASHQNGPASEAFLAGLFHDTGKLVILNLIADVQRKRKHAVPAGLIESAFDAFHVAVGENACRTWGLPDNLIAAVSQHHVFPIPDDPLTRSVVLGNRIAHLIESEKPSPEPEKDDPFQALLNFGPEEVARLVSKTKGILEEFSTAVS